MPSVTLPEIADYLLAYCEHYYIEFLRLTSPEANESGLLNVAPPPFASTDTLECWQTIDGAILFVEMTPPNANWFLSGGPAFYADTEPSSLPDWVVDFRRKHNLIGKQIGITKIHADSYPPGVNTGQRPIPSALEVRTTTFNKRIVANECAFSQIDLFSRLTLGTFGHILKLKLREERSDFWDHQLLKNLGFISADYSHRIFCRLLELVHNLDVAAWDQRSIWVRVRFDCLRDCIAETEFARRPGGMISVDQKSLQLTYIEDKTREFERAIKELKVHLIQAHEDRESIFHAYLKKYPQLIDLYGEVLSQPRLTYPAGGSPTGKNYVVPDFVVSYTDGTFRFVEIERPNKGLTTASGHPTAQVTQAAFQLTEFRTFVESHAHSLQVQFPGIRASNVRYTLIIGSNNDSSQSRFKTFDEMRAHVRDTFAADDVWVYEDLVSRAEQALSKIRSVVIS